MRRNVMWCVASIVAASAGVVAATGVLAATAGNLVAAAGIPVAITAEPARRGHLVLIGGGDKPVEAMRKFVELAGGPSAPIIIIPTASEEADTGSYYEKLFKDEHGCTDAISLDIKTRDDAAKPAFVERAAKARGIFFGGGDQVRITRALLETPVGRAIADAFARGAVIGGTSAGTACQSDPMITGEGDLKIIRAGNVEVTKGLGFLPGVIVDQHFIARQRSNRLISAILEHPDLLGVGVDEDTAIWVRPDDTLEVMGRSSVVVIDAKDAALTRRQGGKDKDLLGVRNLRVHVLLPGDVFDLARRAVVEKHGPGPAEKEKP